MKHLVISVLLMLSVGGYSNRLFNNDNNNHCVDYYITEKSQIVLFEKDDFSYVNTKPNPVFTLFRKKQKDNKRITAAALAFPFPFGIVGLHRIYLGTKPYVPVAYIGTAGGVFGILPLVDFMKIVFDKDIEPYQKNGKVFMWIKE
jgi:TM2 domain-containing membrane protein YozV